MQSLRRRRTTESLIFLGLSHFLVDFEMASKNGKESYFGNSRDHGVERSLSIDFIRRRKKDPPVMLLDHFGH